MTQTNGVAAEDDARSRRIVLTTVLTVALLLPVITVAAEAAGDRIVSFDIPRQRADQALIKFAEQADVTFIFPADEARKVTANAVRGEYTPGEAIRMLLWGTKLQPNFQPDGALSVNAIQSTSEQGDSVKKRGPLAGLLAAILGTTVGEAGADQAATETVPLPTSLNEIVVTARKREERWLDVPISIAVVSNQEIERRGLIGMEDYLRSIPGVNQIDNGPASNAIVIRGITTSPEFENFFSGTTVASYFDETSTTGAAGPGQGGIDIRPVDIERIEILRGPQGTAFGSASLGGAMRMIPVKPKLDGFDAELVASYSDTSGDGSDNSILQGIVNIPLVVDKFALRAVGYRYDESGFYRNIAGTDPATIAAAELFGLGDYVRGHVQDDVGRIVSDGGRLAALWQATDKLDLSINFLTQTIEQDGNPAADVGKFEQARVPIAPQARVRGESGEIADTDMDLLNFVVNYDLGWATLTSVVSEVNGESVTAGSIRGIGLFFLGPSSTTAPGDFKSLTGEMRLASQLEGRFQFLGGVFYEDVEEDYSQTLDWPGPPATVPFGTNPMLSVEQTRDLEQRAIFGEVSYDLTDKFTATVGGRYFEYDKFERNLTEGGLFGIPIGSGVPVNLESTESDSSFKANISYKPTNDSLLYATWAEGFRLGRPQVGLTPATCDTNNDGIVDGTSISIESTRAVNSDFLDNYEIGGKFTFFDRRMIVDASIYHIKWDGLPITSIVSSCNGIYTANVGEATSDGAEFQASLFVAEGLRLDFGGAYNKAELSEDAPTLNAQDGDPLPGSPEVSVNLGLQYDFRVAGRNAFVRADSYYAGEFYGDLQETPDTKAGDYIKVDARGGVAFNNFSVEIFVRNLTDESAFTWRGISVGNGEFFGYRLRPRTVGLQLSYNFQ